MAISVNDPVVIATGMTSDANQLIHSTSKEDILEVPALINFEWILDATRGVPAFSRERLNQIIAIYEEVKDHGGTYEMVDLLGKKYEMTAKPTYCLSERDGTQLSMKIAVGYNSYQSMAEEDDVTALDHGQAFPFAIWHSSDNHMQHDCHGIGAQLIAWEEEWEKSKYRQDLIRHLEEHGPKMVDVEQIVCFGLGPIGRFSNEIHYRRSYFQHLAACTVRDFLEEQQSKSLEQIPPQKIEIYAQDPSYCDKCRAKLREKHGIEVVENPYGFAKVDSNTFVLTFSPDIPVRQIVADLTIEYHGPAGMLCDEIESDGLEYAVRSYNSDMNCTMSSYTTDPPSPNLAKYRDRCIVLSLNDKELPHEKRLFGRTALYLKQK
jgi:hypothetical protein